METNQLDDFDENGVERIVYPLDDWYEKEAERIIYHLDDWDTQEVRKIGGQLDDLDKKVLERIVGPLDGLNKILERVDRMLGQLRKINRRSKILKDRSDHLELCFQWMGRQLVKNRKLAHYIHDLREGRRRGDGISRLAPMRFNRFLCDLTIFIHQLKVIEHAFLHANQLTSAQELEGKSSYAQMIKLVARQETLMAHREAYLDYREAKLNESKKLLDEVENKVS